MTYLEIVNSVLRRLRETEVSSVNDNAYAKMIAEFVNDAKRQVENTHDWNALTETLTAVTSIGTFSYGLTGAGQRFKVIDVLNDSTNTVVNLAHTNWLNQQFLANPAERGAPSYYNFNGVDENGDTRIDFYPVPDSVYTIRINLILPQDDLVNNTDKLLIPSEPVVFLAYAKALAERGEDGGLASSEAYGLYKNSLADLVAIESNRYVESSMWVSV
jgi:hypothetical protein